MEETGCCGSEAGDRPLPVLLSRAEALFVAEFDRRLAGSDFDDLALAHSGNVLRFLMEGPRRASQFIGACGVSKQAVSQQIAQLERRGYIESTPDPQDQRARILALTERGHAAQARVNEIFADVEEAWAQRLGATDADTLRRVLERLLG
jgi:DNA-binding MarR family transcriptional regulator